MTGSVLFDTRKGDVNFPGLAPANTVSPNGSIDGMPIGQVTRAAVNATTLNASGSTVLAGAVSGAGFVAAVDAIANGQVFARKTTILAPLPADLISIVAAVTPTNVALTIAAQPPQARKFQVRVVIGTSPTTAITAGNLAIIGVDQDGNAVSENISLITTASVTLKSVHAYASVTSATVSAYAASGSGTGNTVGLGPSNDFGIACGQGAVTGFALLKATKVITTFVPNAVAASIAWSRAVTDDLAGSAVVDATARTVAPTTAPGVAGINDYEFSVSFSLAA